MSYDRFAELVEQLCGVIGLPDAAAVLDRRVVEVEGFTVVLDHVDSDPKAMYLQFDFGIATTGRTLRIFRLMLESNLLVYAQDQAQLGIDPDSGAVLLIMRVPFSRDLDGEWLAETLGHYAEHGRYWRTNMLEASDDEFDGIAQGNFAWIKA
jgi:Tir chaperone protein (CesT) family